jgi:hypothetical protein
MNLIKPPSALIAAALLALVSMHSARSPARSAPSDAPAVATAPAAPAPAPAGESAYPAPQGAEIEPLPPQF